MARRIFGGLPVRSVDATISGPANQIDFSEDAEQWLKAQRGSKSFGVTELKKDFYYLRSAIETVLKSNPRGRDLPYAIAKEYRERKSPRITEDLMSANDGSFADIHPGRQGVVTLSGYGINVRVDRGHLL